MTYPIKVQRLAHFFQLNKKIKISLLIGNGGETYLVDKNQ